jgi:hypothetical protein
MSSPLASPSHKSKAKHAVEVEPPAIGDIPKQFVGRLETSCAKCKTVAKELLVPVVIIHSLSIASPHELVHSDH